MDLQNLLPYYPAINWKRYRPANGWYEWSDGVLLTCMIGFLRPHRIVEIGCGWSTAAMLDAFDACGIRGQITCIDPDLQRVPFDARISRIRHQVQHVNVDFSELQPNDILFVDSSHQYAPGSDVFILLNDVLPSLKAGVYIHFHDIFRNFEYPPNSNWSFLTEAPAIREFLRNNANFTVELFGHPTILDANRDWLTDNMPLCLPDPGGSLWIRKGTTSFCA